MAIVVPRNAIWLGLFGLCVSFPIWAVDIALSALEQAVQNKQWTDAARLSEQLADEWTGDVEYDILRARVQVELQQFDQASFTLERVLFARPNLVSARLLLASLYVKRRNYPAAQRILTPLANSQLAPEQQTQYQFLLKQSDIGSQRQTGFYHHNLMFKAGYDSNVNSGTLEDRIYLPILDIDVPLAEDSLEQGSSYTELGYQYQQRLQMHQKWGINLVGQAQHQHYSSASQFDKNYGLLQLQNEYQFRQWLTVLSVSYLPLWVDGRLYREDSELTAGAYFPISSALLVGGQYLRTSSNNSKSSLDFSADQYRAEARIQQLNYRIDLSYGLSKEQADANVPYNSRDIRLASASWRYFWQATDQFALRADYAYQQHQAEHPFFLVVREDRLLSARASWLHQWDERWQTNLSVNWYRKNSNIDLYQYRRQELSLGVNYVF